jgi:hypothetical protein
MLLLDVTIVTVALPDIQQAADPARTAPARHGRHTLGMRGFRWFVDLHKSRSWNPRSLSRAETRATAVTEALWSAAPQ